MPYGIRDEVIEQTKKRSRKRGIEGTAKSLSLADPKRPTHTFQEKLRELQAQKNLRKHQYEADMKELVARYKKGKEDVIEKIIETNEPIIKSVLANNNALDEDMEDVAREGAYMALMEFLKQCEADSKRSYYEEVMKAISKGVEEALKQEEFGWNEDGFEIVRLEQGRI